VVVPPENVPEARLVPGMQVVSAPSLAAVVCWLREEQDGWLGESVEVLEAGAGVAPRLTDEVSDRGPRDLTDVVGQPVARRAAEICAAGGHHMLLMGPPGVGKPMLEIKH